MAGCERCGARRANSGDGRALSRSPVRPTNSRVLAASSRGWYAFRQERCCSNPDLRHVPNEQRAPGLLLCAVLKLHDREVFRPPGRPGHSCVRSVPGHAREPARASKTGGAGVRRFSGATPAKCCRSQMRSAHATAPARGSRSGRSTARAFAGRSCPSRRPRVPCAVGIAGASEVFRLYREPREGRHRPAAGRWTRKRSGASKCEPGVGRDVPAADRESWSVGGPVRFRPDRDLPDARLLPGRRAARTVVAAPAAGARGNNRITGVLAASFRRSLEGPAQPRSGAAASLAETQRGGSRAKTARTGVGVARRPERPLRGLHRRALGSCRDDPTAGTSLMLASHAHRWSIRCALKRETRWTAGSASTPAPPPRASSTSRVSAKAALSDGARAGPFGRDVQEAPRKDARCYADFSHFTDEARRATEALAAAILTWAQARSPIRGDVLAFKLGFRDESSTAGSRQRKFGDGLAHVIGSVAVDPLCSREGSRSTGLSHRRRKKPCATTDWAKRRGAPRRFSFS